ncbi:DsbA family protein [Aureimonas endophytica]|uniref:DsbA family protein n=1 Tax=Aureimonas endophytica TaxID=2027858 RepID=UPI001FCE9AF8|nr:DsbA family protein [Aureimonas endophytica]
MSRAPLRAAALAAFLSLPVLPQAAAAMDEPQKSELRGEIRAYLLEHPEVLLEAMDALEAKRAAEEARNQSAAIASLAGELTATPPGTAIGNPEGDVTLVEFFDYNCGYCKHALTDMEALVAADPKLRVVLKEIPVLGEQSVAASRVSLAFRHLAPQRYGEFHEKLLGMRGVADEDSAIGVAEGLGVAEADLRGAMGSPDVQKAIDENNRLSALLKVNGTPSYVIGDEVVSGAVGREALAAKIQNMRSCAKASC